MAGYQYDESGNMAGYFVLTFLSLILIPVTLSFLPSSESKKRQLPGCQCAPCLGQQENIRKSEKRSLFNPKLSAKAALTLAGWALFFYIGYKVSNAVATNKVYDPFEILGISTSATEKEIKSHYKKLSKIFHPDKVKLKENQTADDAAAHFVELTKAYKSLTDETIRENLRLYGNPDGPQQTVMGIALPPWIVEAQNNIWVLGVYGILFGGALPMLVGRWWFGNRKLTKDGILADSAASFFQTLKEESDYTDVVGALGQAGEWDGKGAQQVSQQQQHLDALEIQIKEKLGNRWAEVGRVADVDGERHLGRRKALILLYAHLLRLRVEDTSLLTAQSKLLLQTPSLLSALLTISLARNWLLPTLAIMRLHAFLIQALPPRKRSVEVAQLPLCGEDEAAGAEDLGSFAKQLGEKGDSRVAEVNKALSKWGHLELVDASFKVIDERVVTPGSIVYLVVKLRISPPNSTNSPPTPETEDVEEIKRRLKANEAKDYEFLTGKPESEPIPADSDSVAGWAHAPYWPAHRQPGWWLVLADDKSNRVVVPPMKINEVPFARPGSQRDFRSYKLQFQAPPNVGLYTWKLYLISDTFVGEEIEKNITLKLDDPATLVEEEGAEDDISDPEEDSLAGQMAMLRGGAVKKAGEDDDSEESGTDDDEDESDSSSDSDSD